VNSKVFIDLDQIVPLCLPILFELPVHFTCWLLSTLDILRLRMIEMAFRSSFSILCATLTKQ